MPHFVVFDLALRSKVKVSAGGQGHVWHVVVDIGAWHA